MSISRRDLFKAAVPLAVDWPEEDEELLFVTEWNEEAMRPSEVNDTLRMVMAYEKHFMSGT